jgi:hypothetical protein
MSLRCGAGLVTICIFNGIVVANLDETTLFQQNQKKKKIVFETLALARNLRDLYTQQLA